MVEYLISLKINLGTVDLRQKTLSHWARQYSRGQILELLAQNGAPQLTDTNRKATTE
jgi:hypothetical protein